MGVSQGQGQGHCLVQGSGHMPSGLADLWMCWARLHLALGHTVHGSYVQETHQEMRYPNVT